MPEMGLAQLFGFTVFVLVMLIVTVHANAVNALEYPDKRYAYVWVGAFYGVCAGALWAAFWGLGAH